MKSLLKALPILLMTPLCFAQGTEHGNGGDEEIQFANITSQTQAWLKKNLDLGKLEEKLSLKTLSGAELYARYQSATQQAQVLFTDQKVIVNGNSRICRNQSNQILCNRDEWRKTQGNVRYAIAFHEYLGIVGIETNTGDYSNYPISKYLLDYVYAVQNFELGMEKTGIYQRRFIPGFNALLDRYNTAKEKKIPFNYEQIPFLDLTVSTQTQAGMVCYYRYKKNQALNGVSLRRNGRAVFNAKFLTENELKQGFEAVCTDSNGDNSEKFNQCVREKLNSNASVIHSPSYQDRLQTMVWKEDRKQEAFVLYKNDDSFIALSFVGESDRTVAFVDERGQIAGYCELSE